MLQSHPKTKDVPVDFQNAKLNMLKSISYNDTSIPNCLAFGPGHHVTLLLSCSTTNFFVRKIISRIKSSATLLVLCLKEACVL
jgi:hypothetical protein